ncbi:ATP-dependent DNA helicase pcrA [Georgfuchsia toluolica]|uniref:DNA 3'-5' helicase n=1 Tax=Georgfuchsia toluolica TaxID=424218 RepID=A0A916NGR0_9PROT|nr:UvrD-helicase domain-containing protein [Georgfuchsia toluolica]CAG4882487.1 ATP-dependent DNA helicase pcrA [Georgfuchsia toluolica]
MTVDLLAIDESSRVRALDVESFIVEAPAGAGKTELLTQRYLRLLALVQEPEEIIAITFTNKAAAEMRTRILLSLSSAMQPATMAAEPHKQITRRLALDALTRDAECGWQLLQTPARLRITTIDALSASLARQMPFLSRFGAQPAISDDSAAHYDAAALRTLALLENDADAGCTMEEALRYFHNDSARLQKLLVSMLERRDQWLVHLDSAEQHEGGAIAALVASDLVRAGLVIDATMQSQLMPIARYAAGNLLAANSDSPITLLADWTKSLGVGENSKNTVIPAQAGIQRSSKPMDFRLRGDDEEGCGNDEEGCGDDDKCLADIDLWRGLVALLLTNSGTLRKRFDKNMGLPAEKDAKPFKETLADVIDTLAQTPGAEAALARIQLLPEPKLDTEEARIVGIFARLLKLAAAQLWTVFQQQREVDFIEIAQRALSALGDEATPTNLQLKLDYRISHLLVDEFQDTSPAQVTLLERLTAGWQPGDGRTLFVVGDPMQSIYRFRKADVGLFLQARQSGIGGIGLESLRLNRNNRSHPEVVNWINATFPAVFPPADNPQTGAVKFAVSVATKSSAATAGVFMHPVLVAKDSENAGGDEARQVIAILRAERAAHPAGSIAILVRARSHLDALVTELQRSAPELRYQAVEIEALVERQVVQDLLALTRALHHRGDRVNWLAVLRAPWCGLTLPDLHALAADDHGSTVWQLVNDAARIERMSADGQQRLLHLRAVFTEALAQQGRLRTRRWVEAVWRMLGGEACLHDAAERVNAEAYFHLIDQLDAGGGFTLDRLDREIASLYAEPDKNADGIDSPAIQIMTVHKSKGLEFDAVILPGLHRAPRNGDNSLLLWEEFVDGHGHEHLVIAPVKPRRGGNDKRPSAYDYLRTLDAERESNESNRVLYVAATRAIRALHLVAAATVQTKEEGDVLKPPVKGSSLAALWPAVEAEFEAARHSRKSGNPATLDLEANSLAGFIPKLTRIASPAIPAYLQGDATEAATVRAEPVEAQDDTIEISRSLLADIGTLAHRTLELIAQDGLDQWNVERVKASQPAFRRWLQGRGHAASVLDDAATQVQEAVSNAISSEAGRWILSKRDEAGNELALTSSQDGRTLSNVIDRTFVENGARWIIDYKTARFEPDAPESDLKARAEIYRPQLERYATLFAEEGLSIRLGIFFLSQGRLSELALKRSGQDL